MSEQADELKKLATIATDVGLAAELRMKAIKLLGNIGSHEALLTLLNLVANDRLSHQERDYALKQARQILKSSRR